MSEEVHDEKNWPKTRGYKEVITGVSDKKEALAAKLEQLRTRYGWSDELRASLGEIDGTLAFWGKPIGLFADKGQGVDIELQRKNGSVRIVSGMFADESATTYGEFVRLYKQGVEDSEVSAALGEVSVTMGLVGKRMSAENYKPPVRK